ncbi:MAG TPA: carbamoyltransferase C-terminal domain-containing protein [Candidatus Binataceae bacterium]|nr:carbamoyltransferase C-terminal domain-containing protein [Candidatus Binataceae bacterium]
MTAILGISGLANSVRFKREHWPGLDEREYRISQGHDAAAAIVVDGQIVAAAAEERFNRLKHSTAFPQAAMEFCLRQAGLKLADLSEIAHAFNYAPYEEIYSLDSVSGQLFDKVFSREALLDQLEEFVPEFPEENVHQVDHHLCHAASASLVSGWDESLTTVIDAMGETQGASIYHARNGRLQRLGQISANDSIGILYSLVTLHLGFDFNSDEYKIMGLAPYGDPSRFETSFAEMLELRPGGNVRIPVLRLNRTRDERENYLKTREWLDAKLIRRRDPDSEITQDHRDVAAALQDCLSRVVQHICGHYAELTGLRRLAMAGGVALNCTANGVLMRSGLFDEIFVQPAAGDDGAALGAALFRASLRGALDSRRMPTPLLGPAYDRAAMTAALDDFATRVTVRHFDDFAQLTRAAAERIRLGEVIGWYRGRMEFGPRALGNRSILADPGHPQMRDRINAMVKMREAFRPFAPAVSIEQVHRWFEVPPLTSLPYMIATVMVRPDYRRSLPAITHIDGSARVQTVAQDENPDFHQLLRAVGTLTGREMVLNTSFNVKGQPIVNTPREAIETFLGTGIDCLFLGDTLVTRA